MAQDGHPAACKDDVRRMPCATHREHHGIAQDLYEVLVQETHISGPKETQSLRTILLDSNELLHSQKHSCSTAYRENS